MSRQVVLQNLDKTGNAAVFGENISPHSRVSDSPVKPALRLICRSTRLNRGNIGDIIPPHCEALLLW